MKTLTAHDLLARACAVKGALSIGDPDLLARTMRAARADLARGEEVLARMIGRAHVSGDDYVAQTGAYERAVKASAKALAYKAALDELRAAVKEVEK